MPELAEFGTVREIPFRRLSSHALTSADWLDLARTVQTLLDRADCDGVVITHGTNTLEETAYFLRLTVNSDKPVGLTGAMRPASALGADGYLNLVRAVQVAAAPQARGRGVLVVMNDRIHDARDVTKASTMRVDAFVAPDSGPLGSTDTDGLVVFSRERTHPDSPIFTLPDVLPRVDIVLSYVDADGVFVEAAVAAGAKGIVCAATGAGWPTPLQQTALERAAANNVVVCFASRTGSGRVPHTRPGPGDHRCHRGQPFAMEGQSAAGARPHPDHRPRRDPTPLRPQLTEVRRRASHPSDSASSEVLYRYMRMSGTTAQLFRSKSVQFRPTWGQKIGR